MKWNHYHGGDKGNFKFLDGNPKWPSSKYNLTYQFTFSGSATTKIDNQTLSSVCAQAFATWAAVSHFQFKEVGEGEHADIFVGFRRGDHGDGAPFDGPGNVVGHAFFPTDGRLHYDADENWSSSPASDQLDLESVTVHEIGHILGLGHTSDGNAVMFPTIGQGMVKRQLGSDDIMGRAQVPISHFQKPVALTTKEVLRGRKKKEHFAKKKQLLCTRNQDSRRIQC
ncbi:hypothetical protein MKX01_040022 [Papaver californicum]|nr:hypothetical protein MKX01_040022 [Papaver californicum]